MTTVKQLKDRLTGLDCLDSGTDAGVDAAELYLYPFGPNGGQKAGVQVKAANGSSFTVEEIIFKALEAQARYLGGKAPTHGIGIYRSGLHRGVPSYYLWGSESKLSQPG